MDMFTDLPRPTRSALAEARGDLSPAQAGELVGISADVWIGYETDYVMPVATWALFLLATHQNPNFVMDRRRTWPSVRYL